MTHKLFLVFVFYISILSIISMIVTIADKVKAQKGKRRVPENTLLLLAALGGSLAMYAVMLIIRHKTRHSKFMWGLPIIMLFQCIAIWYCFIRTGVLPPPG